MSSSVGGAFLPSQDYTIQGAWRFAQLPTGASPIQTATVTLTDDQIKALPTTPVEILPTSTVATVCLPLRIVLIVPPFAVPYVNINAAAVLTCGGGAVGDNTGLVGAIYNGAGNGANAIDYLLAGGLIVDLPVPFLDFRTPTNTGWGVSPSATPYPNQLPLRLWADNGEDGNFTGGDPANTLKVTVLYAVIDL